MMSGILVIDENAKKMLSQDVEQVDFFLRTTMTKVLDLIDQVEDDSASCKTIRNRRGIYGSNV